MIFFKNYKKVLMGVFMASTVHAIDPDFFPNHEEIRRSLTQVEKKAYFLCEISIKKIQFFQNLKTAKFKEKDHKEVDRLIYEEVGRIKSSKKDKFNTEEKNIIRNLKKLEKHHVEASIKKNDEAIKDCSKISALAKEAQAEKAIRSLYNLNFYLCQGVNILDLDLEKLYRQSEFLALIAPLFTREENEKVRPFLMESDKKSEDLVKDIFEKDIPLTIKKIEDLTDEVLPGEVTRTPIYKRLLIKANKEFERLQSKYTLFQNGDTRADNILTELFIGSLIIERAYQQMDATLSKRCSNSKISKQESDAEALLQKKWETEKKKRKYLSLIEAAEVLGVKNEYFQ
tara:strand:+ start:187 stop:1212 length:1026 start_codon:yes stop_codon:yes gene_type:complete